MPRVCIVTGNPLLDHLVDEELVPGRINRCQGWRAVTGGKGLNVGRVLVAHGHHVMACGFAGGRPGEQFREIVEREGQESHFTETAADLRIGFLAQDCAGAGATGMLANGFAVSPAECDRCLATVSALLDDCALVICCGSLADPGSCAGLYAAIAAAAAQRGLPCWIDSYGPAMATALQGDHPPALVKPNREEYAGDLPWQRAAECHLSDGAAALTARTPQGAWLVSPPTVTCINPVGSGDSYLAALAHARLSGWPIEAQLRYANAAGALNASMMAVAELAPSAIAELAETVSCEPTDLPGLAPR